MSDPVEPLGVMLHRAFTAPTFAEALKTLAASNAWSQLMYSTCFNMVEDVLCYREQAMDYAYSDPVPPGVMLHTVMDLGEREGMAMLLAYRIQNRISNEQFVMYAQLARQVWTGENNP